MSFREAAGGASRTLGLLKPESRNMKLFFADPSTDINSVSRAGSADRRVVRILTSFWYYKDEDFNALVSDFENDKLSLEIFADSGAFSAHEQNSVVALDEYAEWLLRWGDHFCTYANLDVIRDPEKTWENQKKLEDEYGLSPLPVFHIGTPWKWLDRYLSAGYRYIALGGMAGLGTSRDLLDKWLTLVFRKLSSANAVAHGFGITSWTLLKKYPWYSVDSSAWTTGFRYGTLSLFDDRSGRFFKVRLRNREDVLKRSKLIRSYGVDPAVLLRKDKYDRDLVCYICALSFMKAEDWLNKRAKFPGGKLYLATLNPGIESNQSFVGGDIRLEQIKSAGKRMKIYIGTSTFDYYLPKIKKGFL